MTAAVAQTYSPDRWDIAIVPSARDAALVAQGSVTWPDMVRNLTVPCEHNGNKLDVPGWIPARFKDGADRRLAANVESVTVLVLDLDQGDDAARVREAVAGFRALWHSSWSHTPEQPKGRLVLPFFEPCPVERWPAVWLAAASWAEGLGLTPDKAAKDAARLYFLPAAPYHRPVESWVRDSGAWMSWRWLLAHHSPPPPPREFRPVLPTRTRGLDGHSQEGRRRRFALGVVRTRCRELAAMGEGAGRNTATFRASAAAAQLAAAGVLDLDAALQDIRAAALASGLSTSETDRTIHSGTARGTADGAWSFDD